jgi:hypothetical protein
MSAAGDWIYEVKFDGYRALALRGGPETKLLSRNQKDLGKKFPEIVEAIASLDLQDAIIDYAASGIGKYSVNGILSVSCTDSISPIKKLAYLFGLPLT